MWDYRGQVAMFDDGIIDFLGNSPDMCLGICLNLE